MRHRAALGQSPWCGALRLSCRDQRSQSVRGWSRGRERGASLLLRQACWVCLRLLTVGSLCCLAPGSISSLRTQADSFQPSSALGGLCRPDGSDLDSQ